MAALTALTTTAFAADLKPYIEGSIGYKNPENNIKSKDGTTSVDVDSDVSYGIELGLKDVIVPGVRLSLSEEYMHNDVKNSSTKVAINTYAANIYYDFKTSTPFTPYIGAGIGGYKANNYDSHEWAASLKAGVNYSINQNVYAGLKAAYYYYDEGTTKSATPKTYDSFDAYSVNAVLGYNF